MLNSLFLFATKVIGDVKNIEVPKEYIHIVVGKGRNNLEKIETKTGTKIIVPSRQDVEGRLQYENKRFVSMLLDLKCYCLFAGKFPKLSFSWHKTSAFNIFWQIVRVTCFCSLFWFK